MAKRMQLSPFDMALNYLSYRDRTEKEMRDYLAGHHIRETAIDAVIDKLKDYDYINDERLFRRLCEQNAEGKRFGKRRLRHDLKQMGFADSLLARLDTLIDDQTERTCLAYHFAKAEKRYAGDAPAGRRRKISAYLMRRGFGYEAIAPFFDSMADSGNAASDGSDADDDKLLYYYEKYMRMQSRKGYTGRELKLRVRRNLAQRGFGREAIDRVLLGHAPRIND